VQRRLAAILAADVVGYSKLMGEDEAGTLAALRQLRRGLLAQAVTEFRGNPSKAWAGWLVEFPSAVDAVTCAIKVQESLTDQDLIKLRIGLHIGDVTFEDEDIYGDGVNIAARLQEIASPGAIVISDNARRSIDGKLAAAFQELGLQELKNIADPVIAYAWVAANKESSEKETALPLPDKPSIAVLPFDNMSGDQDQEYFSDGIAEDIITNLSRMRWLFVIARNSTFTFKGQAVDIRRVTAELGVRYVLEGSVRKAANRVRITAQLIDAATSNHIWAERYDRELTDIFAVQDEITEQVAGAIEPAILTAESLRASSRSRSDLDAWDFVIHGLSSFWQMTEEDSTDAIEHLRAATRSYPKYGPAHSMLAFAMLFAGQMGWIDFVAIRDEAKSLASRALARDDQDAWTHLALGYMHTMDRNPTEAILEFGKSLALNPNFAAAYGWQGLAKAHAGETDDAIADAEMALRLSPKDPFNVIFLAATSLAHFWAGRVEECLNIAQEVVRQRPGYISGLRMRCVALGKLDRFEEAKSAFDEIRRRQPNTSATLLRRTLPHSVSENLEEFISQLKLASMPE